jgi:hypothetical protein
MAKFKAGEWFQWKRYKCILITGRPDADGEYRATAEFYNGVRGTMWFNADMLRESKPLKRQPWIVWRVTANRRDGYKFFAVHSPKGYQAYIVAGCRCFTVAEAKKHWAMRDRQYVICEVHDKELNAWSLAFVAQFEKHLATVR